MVDNFLHNHEVTRRSLLLSLHSVEPGRSLEPFLYRKQTVPFRPLE